MKLNKYDYFNIDIFSFEKDKLVLQDPILLVDETFIKVFFYYNQNLFNVVKEDSKENRVLCSWFYKTAKRKKKDLLCTSNNMINVMKLPIKYEDIISFDIKDIREYQFFFQNKLLEGVYMFVVDIKKDLPVSFKISNIIKKVLDHTIKRFEVGDRVVIYIRDLKEENWDMFISQTSDVAYWWHHCNAVEYLDTLLLGGDVREIFSDKLMVEYN